MCRFIDRLCKKIYADRNIRCDRPAYVFFISRVDNQRTAQRTETIAAAGYATGIYGSANWLDGKVEMKELSGYHTWLAEYAEYLVNACCLEIFIMISLYEISPCILMHCGRNDL